MKFTRKQFKNMHLSEVRLMGKPYDLMAASNADPSGEGKRYRKQIEMMAENARKWRRDNPGRQALVAFPKNVQAVGIPIRAAVADKFVSGNDAGIELLKAMWPWDVQDEPTVEMTRMALEMSTK